MEGGGAWGGWGWEWEEEWVEVVEEGGEVGESGSGSRKGKGREGQALTPPTSVIIFRVKC
jgi:hypothetical protein